MGSPLVPHVERRYAAPTVVAVLITDPPMIPGYTTSVTDPLATDGPFITTSVACKLHGVGFRLVHRTWEIPCGTLRVLPWVLHIAPRTLRGVRQLTIGS